MHANRLLSLVCKERIITLLPLYGGYFEIIYKLNKIDGSSVADTLNCKVNEENLMII